MEIRLLRAWLTGVLFLLNEFGSTICTDCYSCVNITDPADCHHIQRCTSKQCFITKIEYQTGEVYFTLGCSNHNVRECSDYLLPEISSPYVPNNHSTVSVTSKTSKASSTISQLSTLQPVTQMTKPSPSLITIPSVSTETVSKTNVAPVLTQTTPSSAVNITPTFRSTTQMSSSQSIVLNVTIAPSASSTVTDAKTSIHSSQNSSQYTTAPVEINNSSQSSTTSTTGSTYRSSAMLSSSSTNFTVSAKPPSVSPANVTISSASSSQETKISPGTTIFSVFATTLPISTSTDKSTLISSTTPFTPTMKTSLFTSSFTNNATISTGTARKSSVLITNFSTSPVSNTTSPSKRVTTNSSAIISSSTSLASLVPSTPTYAVTTFSTRATDSSSVHNGSVSYSPSLESTLSLRPSPGQSINSIHTFPSAPPSFSQISTDSKQMSSLASSTISSKLNSTKITTPSLNLTTYTPIMHSTSFYSNMSFGTSQVSSANFIDTSSPLASSSHKISQSPQVSTSVSSTTFDKSSSVSASTPMPLLSVTTPISNYHSFLSTTTPPVNSTLSLKTSSAYSANRTYNQSSRVPDSTSPSSRITTDSLEIKSSASSTGTPPTPSSAITLTPLSNASMAHTRMYTSASPLTFHEHSTFSSGSTDLSASTKSLKSSSSVQNNSVQRTANSTVSLKFSTPPFKLNSTTPPTSKTLSGLARTSNIQSVSTQSLSVSAYNKTTSFPRSTPFYQPLESQTIPSLSLDSSTPDTVSHSRTGSTFPITPTLPINYSRSQMPSSSFTGISTAFMIPTPPTITSDFNNKPFSTHSFELFTTLNTQSVNESSKFNSVTVRNIIRSHYPYADVLSRNHAGVFSSRSEESLNSVKDEDQRKKDANAVRYMATLCCDELGCNKHLFESCKDLNVGCALLKEDFDICSKPQEAQKICRKTCALCDYADGNWSDWSQWSICSVTCGNGAQLRSRSCTNPAPAHGGRNCSGDSAESRDCQTIKCPADGSWSSWSPWSVCSVSCGYGLRRRDRTCSNPKPDPGGMFCIGDSRDDEICEMNNQCSGTLPVAQWEEWSSWSSCLGSCTLGIKYRQRNCSTIGENGIRCQDSSTESDLCLNEKQNCEGIWMPWSTWSECSSTCGYGTKARLRGCTGYSCQGASSERQICANIKCEDLDSAFFATGPSADGRETGTIILQQVKTNVGGDYDVTTGTFVCRIPGFYRFFVHIEKQPNIAEAYCHINLNHEQTVSVSALANFGSIGYDIEASNTAVLHLEKGDLVRLGGCTRAQTFTNFTSFSGMLLTPD